MGGPVLSQDVEVTDEEEALDETEGTPQLSDLELEDYRSSHSPRPRSPFARKPVEDY